MSTRPRRRDAVLLQYLLIKIRFSPAGDRDRSAPRCQDGQVSQRVDDVVHRWQVPPRSAMEAHAPACGFTRYQGEAGCRRWRETDVANVCLTPPPRPRDA